MRECVGGFFIYPSISCFGDSSQRIFCSSREPTEVTQRGCTRFFCFLFFLWFSFFAHRLAVRVILLLILFYSICICGNFMLCSRILDFIFYRQQRKTTPFPTGLTRYLFLRLGLWPTRLYSLLPKLLTKGILWLVVDRLSSPVSPLSCAIGVGEWEKYHLHSLHLI